MPSPDSALEPELAALLVALAGELACCRDPWWVIGSAAMALHGASPLEVADVDLLLGPADAAAVLDRRGIAAVPGTADGRFHSDIFGRWTAPPRAVELFGGFKVRSGGAWREIVPETREAKRVGGSTLFVPSVGELIALGRLFGRSKDAAREPLLLKLLA